MQLDDMDMLAQDFCRRAQEYFGDKAADFIIKEVLNAPGHMEFEINFSLYNYADISVSYENGGIGGSIWLGKYPKGLSARADYFRNVDFNRFFREIQEEVELWIPDKYLKAKGWK